MNNAAVIREMPDPAADTKILRKVCDTREKTPNACSMPFITNSMAMQDTKRAMKNTATDTGEINT